MSFIRSGHYNWNGGYLGSRRSNGLYWSSKADSGTSAYGLAFYGSNINPRNGYNRGYGFAVRCVAR